MSKKQTGLKEGDRIILKANKREGWPEERAEVESGEVENGTLMVRVDECYREEDDGDGLREVTLSQVKRLDTHASSTGRVMADLLVRLLENAQDDAGDTPACDIEDALEEAGLLPPGTEGFVADFSDCDAERLASVPRVRRAFIKLIESLTGTVQQVSGA